MPKPARNIAAEGTPSIGSFAGLLENPALASPSENRTFTFSELGMFGRSRGIPSPGTDSTSNDVVTTGAAEDLLASGSLSDSRTAFALPKHFEARGVSQVRAQAVPDCSAVGEYLEEQRQPLVKEAPLVMMAAEMSETEASLPVSAKGLVSAKLPAQPRSCQETNTVNLVVNGPNGALTILARETGSDDEDQARLRRLIDGVTSEFGMRISEFYLNGSVVDQSFSTIIGGNHGDSAR